MCERGGQLCSSCGLPDGGVWEHARCIAVLSAHPQSEPFERESRGGRKGRVVGGWEWEGEEREEGWEGRGERRGEREKEREGGRTRGGGRDGRGRGERKDERGRKGWEGEGIVYSWHVFCNIFVIIHNSYT